MGPSGGRGGPDALARHFAPERGGMAGAPPARRRRRRDIIERASTPIPLSPLATHRAEPGDKEPRPDPGLLRRSRHDDHPAREQGPAPAAAGDDGVQLPALGARTVELSRGEPGAALAGIAARVPHRARPSVARWGKIRGWAGGGTPRVIPHT